MSVRDLRVVTQNLYYKNVYNMVFIVVYMYIYIYSFRLIDWLLLTARRDSAGRLL